MKFFIVISPIMSYLTNFASCLLINAPYLAYVRETCGLTLYRFGVHLLYLFFVKNPLFQNKVLEINLPCCMSLIYT